MLHALHSEDDQALCSRLSRAQVTQAVAPRWRFGSCLPERDPTTLALMQLLLRAQTSKPPHARAKAVWRARGMARRHRGARERRSQPLLCTARQRVGVFFTIMHRPLDSDARCHPPPPAAAERPTKHTKQNKKTKKTGLRPGRLQQERPHRAARGRGRHPQALQHHQQAPARVAEPADARRDPGRAARV